MHILTCYSTVYTEYIYHIHISVKAIHTLSWIRGGRSKCLRQFVPGVSWWSGTPGPEVSAGTPAEHHEGRWSGLPQSGSTVQHR